MKKIVFFAFALLLVASISYAGSYIELYPKDGTSRLYGGVNVFTCTDGDVFGTDCGNVPSGKGAYGFIIEIASGTVTLPEVQHGMCGCVKSTTAAVVNIDVYVNDKWVLDGTALDAGDKITSTGFIDDTVCFYGKSNGTWTTVHNPDEYADGG